MIVYKCDNCEGETDPLDGMGRIYLLGESLLLCVNASILTDRTSAEKKWLSPSEHDGIHICSLCVLNAARTGAVSKWNSATQQWEAVQ